VDALPHFARCLVGERDAEDAFRRNASSYHVRDAAGDDASFAGAGAGKDQHRPLDRLNGETLLRIQRSEMEHRRASVDRSGVEASGSN
jgi:hypothetical protein